MARYLHLQNLPEVFANYFLANKEIHNYNTRTSSLLHKNCNRTNYAKHTLANKGIDVWNNLPTQYKDIKSYGTFKKKYEKVLSAFKNKCMKCMFYYTIGYILIMIVVNKNNYLSTSLLLYHSLLFFPSFLPQKHLNSN